MNPIFSWAKNVAIVTLPATLLVLVFFECVFRFIIPAAETPAYRYDSVNHVLKFDPLVQTTGTYTLGPLARPQAKWRINNDGWNSIIDYEVSEKRPVLAVIGDSYIEALQVDVGKNIADRLRADIGSQFAVYSFGVSGLPLSGYLQLSRYVAKTYKPAVMVLNVVHNDFDESLCNVSYLPGTLCYDVIQGEIEERKIDPYVPNTMRRLLGHSSLVRYLYVNLRIGETFSRIENALSQQKREFNANVDVVATKSKRGDIEIAVDYTLRRLREENKNVQLVIVVDAPRRDIYAGKVDHSNVTWMNRLLMSYCRTYNILCVDLSGPFTNLYATEKRQFEITTYDGHWNEYAHANAEQVLLDSMKENLLAIHEGSSM